MSVKLLNALQRHPSAPCDKYACVMRSRCASELLACESFRHYAITGHVDSPRTKYPERTTKHDRPYQADEITPTREIYESLEHDNEASADAKGEKVAEAIAGGLASKTELEKAWG